MTAPIRMLAVALLCSLAPSQQATDWRLPFRNPDVNLAPPESMFKELHVMQQAARSAPAGRVWFDENGVEVVDDETWRAAHARLLGVRMDAGYLSLVVRESRNAADRATAFYGSFYLPDPATVMRMIEHIPGEPRRDIREDAYTRAIAFLRVHLPKVNDGDLQDWLKLRVGPAGEKPPKPGEFSFGFDLVPFAKLCDVEDWRDHVQVMWFFARCLEIRPALNSAILELVQHALPGFLDSEHEELRLAATEFLALADPQRREAPPADAGSERRQRWLADVLRAVFPTVHAVSSGLTFLRTNEELDAIVAKGRQLLTDGSLGEPTHGRARDGHPYRGLRIQRAPEPLDRLGIAVGWIVTSINGQPVATTGDALRYLDGPGRRSRNWLIEYVDDGKLHAKDFRLVD